MTATGSEIATLQQLLMLKDELYYKAGDTVRIENVPATLGELEITDGKVKGVTLSITLDKIVPKGLTATTSYWWVDFSTRYRDSEGNVGTGSHTLTSEATTAEVRCPEGTSNLVVTISIPANDMLEEKMTGAVWIIVQGIDINFS